MKTPKRESEHRWCPVGETRDYQPTLAAKERARWKRKNRIRQLKNTIARQKKEYERLWESFSHMSKRCCQLLYPTDKT